MHILLGLSFILLFIRIFKGIPLLDCMGSRYSCCNRSFNPHVHILRSVNLLSSFTIANNSMHCPLATWLASKGSLIIVQGQISGPLWGYTVNVASLAMSMTVNALVTGLIVLRIFKVFRKVKVASDDQSLGTASSCGGRKLRSIIFILIESGMALFSIQLVRLVVSIVSTDAAYKTYELIVAIHQQINVIIRLFARL